MRLVDGLDLLDLKHFRSVTLFVESPSLQGNPLGDAHVRRTPVLIPKDVPPRSGWPVVLVLAGFTGNGPNYFNLKSFEDNFPTLLDRCVGQGDAPRALYVFCDAWTSWGGSQFINSRGTGSYADYISTDLVAALTQALPVASESRYWCVMGGSSGGYGALSLASQTPERFGVVAALAPDSFFEASLLPEIWTAWPSIQKLGGVAGVKQELDSGKLTKKKEWHAVLNTIAMGLCYAPDAQGGFLLPIDPQTGVLKPEVWKVWKAHDPIEFLRERANSVKQISQVLLDVGFRDQFHLQFGSRQIRGILEDLNVPLRYSEFDGTHFDLGERRPEVWRWLKSIWES